MTIFGGWRRNFMDHEFLDAQPTDIEGHRHHPCLVFYLDSSCAEVVETISALLLGQDRRHVDSIFALV